MVTFANILPAKRPESSITEITTRRTETVNNQLVDNTNRSDSSRTEITTRRTETEITPSPRTETVHNQLVELTNTPILSTEHESVSDFVISSIQMVEKQMTSTKKTKYQL